MTTIELGSTVKRINSDQHYNGRIGRVIETDADKCRARVAWNNHPRTWVSYRFLEVQQQEAR